VKPKTEKRKRVTTDKKPKNKRESTVEEGKRADLLVVVADSSTLEDRSRFLVVKG
jgi:hypothetical protein